MKTPAPHSPPTAAQLDALARFAEFLEDLCTFLAVRLAPRTFLGTLWGMTFGGVARSMLMRMCEDMRGLSERMRESALAAQSEADAGAPLLPSAQRREDPVCNSSSGDASGRIAPDRDALRTTGLHSDALGLGDPPPPQPVAADVGKPNSGVATDRATREMPGDGPGDGLGDGLGEAAGRDSPYALLPPAETITVDATDAPALLPVLKDGWRRKAARPNGLPVWPPWVARRRSSFEPLGSVVFA